MMPTGGCHRISRGAGFAPVVAVAMLMTVVCGLAQEVATNAADPETDRFFTANALYNRKLYAAAIPEYQAFLAAYPKHAKAEQARFGLALSYFGSGNFAEARPLLTALLAKGEVGDKAQLAVLLGQCHLENRDLAQAGAAFAAGAAANGAAAFRAAALALLADVCFRQNRWTNTIEAADSLAKLEPQGESTARAGYQGAYARLQLGKFDEAIATLTALAPAVQGTALQARTAFLLGEALRATGKLEQAAEQYSAAATNETGAFAAEALFRVGYVDFQLKKYEAAFAALGKSLGLQGQGGFSDEARLLAGRAALERKDYRVAASVLRPLSQATNAVAGEATLWLARVHSRQNDFAEAEKLLLGSLPRFRAGKSLVLPDLLFDGAAAAMAQQKYDKADDLFAEIESLGLKVDRLQDVIRLRATCLHYTKQFANSLAYTGRFIAMNGTNAATPFMNEVMFMHAENQYLAPVCLLDPTLQAFREFLRLFPRDANADAAAWRVSQLLYRKSEWAEALKHAEPLAARKPEGKVFSQLSFVVGDSHFRLGHWGEALTNLTVFANQAPATEPNVDTALLEMALAAQRLNNPALATTHLAALVAASSKSERGKRGQGKGDDTRRDFAGSDHLPVALSELGRLQYEAKDYGSARATLQRLVASYSNSAERVNGEYYLGWIDLKESHEREAANHFGRVVELGPTNPLCADSLLQLGLLALKLEQYPEAYGRMQDLLKRFPAFARNDEALYCAGVALSRQKRWGEALKSCFEPFVGRFANSSLTDRVLYERAWCERNQNRPAEAVKQYDALIKSCPQSALIDRARFEMSELTFDAKQYDSTVADLRKAVATAKEPALKEQVLYRLAWAYRAKGDQEDAAKGFEAVLAEFPQSDVAATAHYQAGECRMKLLEYEAARDHFAAALAARNPKEVAESALLRLGESNGLLKGWPESAAAYAKFQNLYPKSRWIQHARYGSGWAHENQKDYEGAIAQYRKVLADKGTDELAAKCQFQIGECLFSLKRYDEAVQELMRVDVTYRFDDVTAKALLEVGRVLEAKGDRAGAAARFKEVIARYPKHEAALVAKERLDGIRSAG